MIIKSIKNVLFIVFLFIVMLLLIPFLVCLLTYYHFSEEREVESLESRFDNLIYY